VNGVDDRLSVGPDLAGVRIKVEDPSERLLRRRNVVAPGAEHHDGRADLAKVDRRAVGGLDSACRNTLGP
jgi:hypothetical protein